MERDAQPLAPSVKGVGQAPTAGTKREGLPVLLQKPISLLMPPATPKARVLAPSDLELTRELVAPLVQDGHLLVTWANRHYLDFVVSWVANVQRHRISGFAVGAMDDELLGQLVKLDIPCWRMNTGISTGDLGWGSSLFHRMGRAKVALIASMLRLLPEVTVIVADIDTAWIRSPLPFLQRFPEADILVSSDSLAPSVKTEALERWPECGAALNIGLMAFRHKSLAFVDAWLKALKAPNLWDQNAFNDLARRGAGRSDANGLFPAWDGRVKMGILPVAQFASGHAFFVQRMYESLGLKPFVAHATFQFSGTPGKRHRLREEQLWHDPPKYYDHPRGFILLRVKFPHALLDAASGEGLAKKLTPDQVVSHFNLVNHQLRYIRAGIALAQLTGRALIMPPLYCLLDKYWAPLEFGTAPGAAPFRRPFLCPMDHVFDIEHAWAKQLPAAQYGPQVEWREHSFLDNPRTPPEVRNSRVTLEVCAPGGGPDGGPGGGPGAGAQQDCSAGSKPATVQYGMARVQPGLRSDQILAALGSADEEQHPASRKVLEVVGADALWPPLRHDGGWFSDAAADARFLARLKRLPAQLSGLVAGNPHWAWYDLLWDVPQHTDKFGRTFDSWHVKLGESGDIRLPMGGSAVRAAAAA